MDNQSIAIVLIPRPVSHNIRKLKQYSSLQAIVKDIYPVRVALLGLQLRLHEILILRHAACGRDGRILMCEGAGSEIGTRPGSSDSA